MERSLVSEPFWLGLRAIGEPGHFTGPQRGRAANPRILRRRPRAFGKMLSDRFLRSHDHTFTVLSHGKAAARDQPVNLLSGELLSGEERIYKSGDLRSAIEEIAALFTRFVHFALSSETSALRRERAETTERRYSGKIRRQNSPNGPISLFGKFPGGSASLFSDVLWSQVLDRLTSDPAPGEPIAYRGPQLFDAKVRAASIFNALLDCGLNFSTASRRHRFGLWPILRVPRPKLGRPVALLGKIGRSQNPIDLGLGLFPSAWP
jgi:hypothetical protein